MFVAIFFAMAMANAYYDWTPNPYVIGLLAWLIWAPLAALWRWLTVPRPVALLQRPDDVVGRRWVGERALAARDDLVRLPGNPRPRH